jgi:hypothetical protein
MTDRSLRFPDLRAQRHGASAVGDGPLHILSFAESRRSESGRHWTARRRPPRCCRRGRPTGMAQRVPFENGPQQRLQMGANMHPHGDARTRTPKSRAAMSALVHPLFRRSSASIARPSALPPPPCS